MNGSQFNIAQNVDRVGTGATVYGVYIHNLENLRSGDFAFDLPNEEMIDTYLEACAEYPQPRGDLTEAQERLLELPVEVTFGVFGDKRLNIYDAVKEIFERRESSRVVILADPAMGRTTGLQQMEREQAQATIDAKEHIKKAETKQKESLILPFYVNLSYLLSERDLFDLMVERFNVVAARGVGDANDEPQQHDWIAKKEQMISLVFSREYRCLFLLDDAEVLLSARQRGAVQDINRFMEESNNQYVIACRTSSYSQQFGAAVRLYLTEIPIHVAKGLIGDTKQFEFLERNVPDQLRKRSRLFQLLAKQKDFVLQRTVGELVREDIRIRLEDKGEKDDSRAWLAERFLEDLAFAMFTSHTICYQEREVLQVMNHYIVDWNIDVSSREVMEYLRAKGILRFDAANRTWSFGHHQAQAYFAAAAIAANSDRLKEIMPEISDYWWREVLVLLAGLSSDPSQFVFDLIDRDELVAANCAEAVQGLLDSRTIEAVIDGLVERMQHEGTLRRKYIVERLGNSPHPKAIQALLLILHRQWSSKVLMATVLAIAGFIAEHPTVDIRLEEEELLARSYHEVQPVGDILELCIHLINWKEHRWKQKWVKGLHDILNSLEESPLRRGLAAIGLGFANDEDTRRQLLSLFEAHDTEPIVSWCALEALTLQADEEEVKKTMLGILNDTSEGTKRRRSQAIFVLGHMKYDPTIITYLMESLGDKSPFVRATAVEALAEKDLSGGRARKSIERLLQSESDPIVLRKAGESLGRIGTADSIPLLLGHTTNPNTLTRRAMKKAILDIRARQA